MLIMLPLVGSSNHITANPNFVMAIQFRTATTSIVTIAGTGSHDIDLSQQEVEDLVEDAKARPKAALEYAIVFKGVREVVAELGQRGSQGWRLVTMIPARSNLDEDVANLKVLALFERSAGVIAP